MTELQKEYNKNHSAKRIVIEHGYLQDKEVQDNERCLQKQAKKVRQDIRHSIWIGKL